MSHPEKPARGPAETWKALEDQAASDEMDRILALGDRALDEELVGLGFDAKAERARSAAMGEKTMKPAEAKRRREIEPLPLKRGARRRSVANRWVFSLAAALGVGVAYLFVVPLLVVQTPVGKPPGPPAGDGGASTMAADELRRAALQACEMANWRECVEGLDRARAVDPAGDGRADVQRWRRAAGPAIEAKDATATDR
jgi:hypothetical protein